MKKYIKSSTDGRKIPYDLVSALVIIRDYADCSGSYINKEHELLVDIADSIYNAEISVDSMLPEYAELYDRYGKDYFDLVIKDAGIIDNQIGNNIDKVRDLIDEYVAKAEEL